MGFFIHLLEEGHEFKTACFVAVFFDAKPHNIERCCGRWLTSLTSYNQFGRKNGYCYYHIYYSTK